MPNAHTKCIIYLNVYSERRITLLHVGHHYRCLIKIKNFHARTRLSPHSTHQLGRSSCTTFLLPPHFIWLNMNKGVFSNAVTLNDHFNMNTMYAVAVAHLPVVSQITTCCKKKKGREKTNKRRRVKASTDCCLFVHKIVNAQFVWQTIRHSIPH